MSDVGFWSIAKSNPEHLALVTPEGKRVMLLDQASQPLLDHMGIDLRRGDVGVAQQLLNCAQIGAAFQQVAGEGVTKDVRRDAGGIEPSGNGKRLQLLPEALAGEMLTSVGGEQPR